MGLLLLGTMQKYANSSQDKQYGLHKVKAVENLGMLNRQYVMRICGI
jgi:hypothetical protein